MKSIYQRDNLAFAYPENWQVDDDESQADSRSVTIYSPEGAFWSVRLESATADAAEMAKAVVEAMQQEYENLDSKIVTETIGEYELIGADMHFYCLDLTSTAQVRILRQPHRTCMILCQAEDREFERVAEVFRAITTSLVTGI